VPVLGSVSNCQANFGHCQLKIVDNADAQDSFTTGFVWGSSKRARSRPFAKEVVDNRSDIGSVDKARRTKNNFLVSLIGSEVLGRLNSARRRPPEPGH
jgi:hypothetical protein